jgi:hypothetical protein
MLRVVACQLTPASEIEVRKAQMQMILTKAEAESVDFIMPKRS